MMWGWHDGSWAGWLAMTLAMVASWGLLIWGIAAIVRGSGRSGPRPDGRDLGQILAERFAAGDFDQDEYQRRLQVLRSARHAAWQR